MMPKLPQQVQDHVLKCGTFDFELHPEYEMDRMGPVWTDYKCLKCGRKIRVEETWDDRSR